MQITIGDPPSDLPAWMQAIGSLIAIAIAIYVPYAERRGQSSAAIEHKKHLATFITGHIDRVISKQLNEFGNFTGQFAASFKADSYMSSEDWISLAEESLAAAEDQIIDLERFKSLPIGDWPSFTAASRYFDLCYDNRDTVDMIKKNWQLQKDRSLIDALCENVDGHGRRMRDASDEVKDAFRQAGLLAVPADRALPDDGTHNDTA